MLPLESVSESELRGRIEEADALEKMDGLIGDYQ